MCGRQLGPVVRSMHAATGADGKGLAVSLLERFIDYNSACAPARRQAGLAPAIGDPSRAPSDPGKPVYKLDAYAHVAHGLHSRDQSMHGLSLSVLKRSVQVYMTRLESASVVIRDDNVLFI